ncbi:MAG TPA: 2-dehydropantoate 2-reductase [Candidatus Baltobacteraceae bacterium]|nr:2-dehydropantoate 2-reductase [Candidatus Baltobacteraceae bacterium]
MRIAVIGAGAIGGYIAAVLARAGADVGVVARGAHLEAIQRDGIAVLSSDLGQFTARVEASDDLRALGGYDVALLAFKSHQWPALLPQLESAAAAGTPVVTLQNGVPFWFRRTPPLRTVDPGGTIGALFPDERVIGGVVHVSGHVAEPGKIRQSGGGRFVLGALTPVLNDLLARLSGVMREAGLKPEVESNIRHFAWLKLINNASLNPVSTIHELTIHQMLTDPVAREEVRALMLEAVAVGRALGVVNDVDLNARMAYAQRLTDVRTSMLQDALAHRPLELDPIVGAVVELGEDAGVPVPRLREVYDILRARTAAV